MAERGEMTSKKIIIENTTDMSDEHCVLLVLQIIEHGLTESDGKEYCWVAKTKDDYIVESAVKDYGYKFLIRNLKGNKLKR